MAGSGVSADVVNEQASHPLGEGLRRAHLPVLLLSVLALAFDLGEIALGSALSAIFSVGPNASSTQAISLLLASVYIGGVIGAGPVGVLADRYGRRRCIVALLAVIAAGSSASAFSTQVSYLIAARAFSGLALGVLPTVIIAYLTEFLPEEGRGRRLMILSALGFLGGPFLLLMISALEPRAPFGLEGWRWALLAGGLGSAVCALFFSRLPETPRWLVSKGRAGEAARVAARFASSPLLRAPLSGSAPGPADSARSRTPPPGAWGPRAALIWALCGLAPLVTIAFPVLSGAIMVERGFSLSDSILFVGLSSYGYILGALAAAPLIEWVERKHALACLAMLMVAGLLCIAIADTAAMMVAGCGVFFAAAASYAILLSIYAAELFDVQRRGRMTCIAWGILRASAVIAILWLTPVLRESGPGTVLGLMVAVLMVSAILAIAFGPASMPRPLGAEKGRNTGMLLS